MKIHKLIKIIKKFDIDKKIVLLFFCILFLDKCVPETPPPGGPEDKDPPKLLNKKSYPINNTINFNQKKLVFIFNKKIKLNNPYEEIKILPSIKKNKSMYGYTYKLIGNIKLIIYLDDFLNKDTDYIINFGNSISSLNGNIPLKNFSISFSTGKEFNSLSVKGNVEDILTGNPIKDVFVSIYKADRKENITNGNPDYFTKTDDKGNFSLSNVKKQKYFVYVSDKINFDNGLQNLEISTIGFISKALDLNKNIRFVKIHALKKNISPLKIKEIKKNKNYIEVKFNKPIKSYEVNILKKFKIFENKPNIATILSNDKSSVQIFNCFYEQNLKEDNKFQKIAYLLEEDQKVKVSIYARDSTLDEIKKDIELHFGDDNFEKEDTLLSFYPKNTQFVDQNTLIKIKSNKPISNLDVTKSYFILENGNKLNIDYDSVILKKFSSEVTIKLSKNPGKILNLILEKGFITSFDRVESQRNAVYYQIKSTSNTGTIIGKQNLGIDHVLIQLLDKNLNVIDEVRDKIKYEFKEVPIGEYTIRIFGLVKDGNKWYQGNLEKREQPDPVFLYHPNNGYIQVKPGVKRTLKTFIPIIS